MLTNIMTMLRPIITRAFERALADPVIAQMIEDQLVAEIKAQLAPPAP